MRKIMVANSKFSETSENNMDQHSEAGQGVIGEKRANDSIHPIR